MANKPPPRCTACGEPQSVVRTTTDYPESGLDNVQLVNVPVWQCPNDHQELQVPAADQLHALLTDMVLRKPAKLTGQEIRFLRKELGMTLREFGGRLGMTDVHLSRIEKGNRRMISSTTNLLVRLTVAWELTRQDRIPFPRDLEPVVDELEQTWDIGSHRLRHRDSSPPDCQWEQAIP